MRGARRRIERLGWLAVVAAGLGLAAGPALAQILDNPTWDKSRIQLERQGIESERARSEIERGRLEADRFRDQPRPTGVLRPPPPTTGEAVGRAEEALRRGGLLRQSERLRDQEQRLQDQADKPR